MYIQHSKLNYLPYKWHHKLKVYNALALGTMHLHYIKYTLHLHNTKFSTHALFKVHLHLTYEYYTIHMHYSTKYTFTMKIAMYTCTIQSIIYAYTTIRTLYACTLQSTLAISSKTSSNILFCKIYLLSSVKALEIVSFVWYSSNTFTLICEVKLWGTDNYI